MEISICHSFSCSVESPLPVHILYVFFLGESLSVSLMMVIMWFVRIFKVYLRERSERENFLRCTSASAASGKFLRCTSASAASGKNF